MSIKKVISYKTFSVFIIAVIVIMVVTMIVTRFMSTSSTNTNSALPAVSWQTYTDGALGYTLRYPDDWHVADEAYQFTKQELAENTLSQRLFFLPYAAPAAWPEVEFGVAVYTVPTIYSLEDIMHHDEDIVESKSSDGSYTGNQPENISRVKVGGYEALRYGFSNPIEGGSQIELLVRKGEMVYDVEASAGDNVKFTQWNIILEQMISDFQVITKATTSNDETDAAVVELGHGYAISLPSGWKVTDREERQESAFVPSAGPEITTTIHQISREDLFDPAVVFETFPVNASLSAQEVAQLADITCKKPGASEEVKIASLPGYVVTRSSDFCEDGTGITFQKYYFLKKQGSPQTLMAIFYAESEAEYNQLKNDFDAILQSVSLAE